MSSSAGLEEKEAELAPEPTGLKTRLVQSEFWRSIFRKPFPRSPEERVAFGTDSFVMHVRPAVISRNEMKFTSTFRLGAMAAGLFGLLAITGALMMFYYVPATTHAYKDMVDLQHVVTLGKVIRNLHHWAAYAMLVVVCLHMLRVFLKRSYQRPRQFNWVVGVGLLVLTLLLSFTGYLLPWDQLAYWGVTVGTSMAGAVPVVGGGVQDILLGGTSVDQPTLLRFYVMHVWMLPLVLAMLLTYHFWRVRKDGHSSGDLPKDAQLSPIGVAEAVEHVPTFPKLLVSEFLAFGVIMAVLVTASLFFDAPLEGLANPGKTPNPVKAPWYFISLQELLHYAPPFMAGVFIPGVLIVGICTIPYFRGKKVLAPLMLLVAALLAPLLDGTIWEGIHRIAPTFADATRVYGLPTIFLLAISAIFLARFARSSRFDNEALVEVLRKRVFLAFVLMLFVLMLIGQFFRGPEWRWVWPWQ